MKIDNATVLVETQRHSKQRKKHEGVEVSFRDNGYIRVRDEKYTPEYTFYPPNRVAEVKWDGESTA